MSFNTERGMDRFLRYVHYYLQMQGVCADHPYTRCDIDVAGHKSAHKHVHIGLPPCMVAMFCMPVRLPVRRLSLCFACLCRGEETVKQFEAFRKAVLADASHARSCLEHNNKVHVRATQ